MQTIVIKTICLNCANYGLVSAVNPDVLAHYKELHFVKEEGVLKCIKCKSNKVLIRDSLSGKVIDIT